MSLNFFQDDIQFLIEMEPELELKLGVGLVRNAEYIGFYFNLTAWSHHIKGMVQVANSNLLSPTRLDIGLNQGPMNRKKISCETKKWMMKIRKQNRSRLT